MQYDTIVRGGTIVDGTMLPRYVDDIGIKDGRIVRIGGLRHSDAPRVIDASGLVVAPGFVDLHTHYDAQLQWDPYCTISGWHGVTSVAIGNCGFGFAPCRPEDRDRAMQCLTRNEAIPYETMKLGMSWDWISFPEFLNTLERIPKGVNVLTYFGLTPLYVWVMGGWDEAKKRRPTKSELAEMCRLLDEGMEAGACGWSAQVMGPKSMQRDFDGTPMVTDLMEEGEVLAFAEVLGQRGGGVIELLWLSEYSATPEGRKFLEQVAAASGRPLLYQIVKPSEENPERHRGLLRWFEECHDRGLQIYGQGDTNRAQTRLRLADWNLFDDNPNWRKVTLGTRAEKIAKMLDPESRKLLRDDWDSGVRVGPSGAGLYVSLDGLLVTAVGREELKGYEGKRIGEIAAAEGKHVVDALLDLSIADDLDTEFYAQRDTEKAEIPAEILRSPYVIPGLSDGGAHVKFRTPGGYPTVLLTWLVRDEGLLTLEEAHYRLSYLPAFIGGFRDRGFLREGAAADLVIYDLNELALGPEEIADDLPGGDWRRIKRADGYRWVMVNGRVTFEDGEPTGEMSGRLLRHGAA